MSIKFAGKRGSVPFTILDKITRNNRLTLLAAKLGAPQSPATLQEGIDTENRFFKFFIRYARSVKP